MAKEKMTSAKKVIKQLEFAIAGIKKFGDNDHVVCVIAQYQEDTNDYRVDVQLNRGKN